MFSLVLFFFSGTARLNLFTVGKSLLLRRTFLESMESTVTVFWQEPKFFMSFFRNIKPTRMLRISGSSDCQV